MQQLLFCIVSTLSFISVHAQNPVGKWKVTSSTIVFEGKKMDTHAALLTIRPCASDIVWEINSDGTFRQNLSGTAYDENYKKIQTKLYSKTLWKLNGNKLFIGGKEGVGHTFILSFSANTMTMTGTDGEGVIVYQKL